MKSYASVDRIEGRFVCCEVELIPIEESLTVPFFDKETQMMDFDIALCKKVAKEGDIWIVEHNEKEIIKVLGKDKDEKKRRVKALEEIME